MWGFWLQQKSYPDALYERLWEDAQLTYRLWLSLWSQIDPEQDAGFIDLYEQIELPLIRILLDMELRGIRVDWEGAAKESAAVKEELKSLQQQIVNSTGSWINPNSPGQVQQFFNAILGGLFSEQITDEAFVDLQDKPPAVEPMLQYRKLSRDIHFLKLASKTRDGRLYPRYHQCRISTGRISITDPPLQSIRKDLRETYLLPEPGHLLVEADFRQA